MEYDRSLDCYRHVLVEIINALPPLEGKWFTGTLTALVDDRGAEKPVPILFEEEGARRRNDT